MGPHQRLGDRREAPGLLLGQRRPFRVVGAAPFGERRQGMHRAQRVDCRLGALGQIGIGAGRVDEPCLATFRRADNAVEQRGGTRGFAEAAVGVPLLQAAHEIGAQHAIHRVVADAEDFRVVVVGEAGLRMQLQRPHAAAEGDMRRRVEGHVPHQQQVVAVEGVQIGGEILVRDVAGDPQATEFGAEALPKRAFLEAGSGHHVHARAPSATLRAKGVAGVWACANLRVPPGRSRAGRATGGAALRRLRGSMAPMPPRAEAPFR